MTQPPPNGDGALRAMRRALNAAGLKPSDVNYINAHATSTPLGDKAENQAVVSLMEGRSPEEVVVSSTKGATGHLLGAAGAVEAVFSVLAIRDVSTCRIPLRFGMSWDVPVCARDVFKPFGRDC